MKAIKALLKRPKMSELPKGPWEEVNVDFYEVSGVHMLVVIDDYSRFPEFGFVHSTPAKAVIPKKDKIFSSYSIPKVVRTNNGPPFICSEFAEFASSYVFKHHKVTPAWLEANGDVERFMRTMNRLVKTSSNLKQQ